MEKAGVRGQKLLKMRKPAHAKKVCGRNMTIILVSAYQTVLKKARSGPTSGAPDYGEQPGAYTHKHTAGSRDRYSYWSCSRVCMRLPPVQKRRAGENIEANDSARSPKFLAPASWPDRNCRLSERPDESTAAVKGGGDSGVSELRQFRASDREAGDM